MLFSHEFVALRLELRQTLALCRLVRQQLAIEVFSSAGFPPLLGPIAEEEFFGVGLAFEEFAGAGVATGVR